MRSSALVAVALAGCLDAPLVACPGDVLCPVGTLCDTTHGGCISPDQAQVCLGLPDQQACRAGAVVGYCLDQICVDPGCGNYIVEPGELCDDGNRLDGDGCSATCLSRERCGDGALDHQLGEACDDGNLQSHDGCDSLCLVETAVWTIDDLGPAHADQHWTAYDPQLGKVVMVADGYVWAWDGVRWSVAATGGPRIEDDYSVVYDVSRARLVVIAGQPHASDFLIPNPPYDQRYEWDGTTWTFTTTTNAPAVNSLVLAYDEARSVVFGFGTTTSGVVVASTLDGATGAWTLLASPAAFTGAIDTTVAFDQLRGRVVAIASVGGNGVTGEWNGTSWSVSSPAMASSGGWSAFYDPSIARVVVVGTVAATGPSPVQSWSGTTWSSLTAVAGRRYQPSVAFDANRGVRFVFGGDLNGVPDDVIEGTASSWTAVSRTTPPPGVDGACGVDEARHRLVCVGGGVTIADTWAWTGTWSPLPGTPGDKVFALTYDPIRSAVVGITNGQLAVLGDTSWQFVSLPIATSPASAIVFDPATRELISSITETFTGKSITAIVDEQDRARSFPSVPVSSLAYDARNQSVVATTNANTIELRNDTWTQIVGPGTGYAAITNARRGTVEFVGLPHDVERFGAMQWIDLAPAPMPLLGSSTFDQSTGELFRIGANGSSRFLLHRRWQSATPFEDCASSTDQDRDGLAGCDDPDCWTRCTPACPPLTTCM